MSVIFPPQEFQPLLLALYSELGELKRKNSELRAKIASLEQKLVGSFY